jgi:hypothetical protein
LPAFLQAILFQGGGEALRGGGGDVRRRGLPGPGEGRRQAAAVEADALGPEEVHQAALAGFEDGLGRQEVAGDGPGTVVLPEVVEAVAQAREVGVEVIADLATQFGRGADEAAPVTGDAEERSPELVALRLGQGEAVDGGAAQGAQVMVVGLVAGVGDLAELFRGEGMDDADVDGRGGEGALGRAVVAAGALDDNDEVAEVVSADRLAGLADGRVEGLAGVPQPPRGQEGVAEAVGKHPLGVIFVAIEAGDAKVSRAGAFDPVVEVAAGLVEGRTWAAGGTPGGTRLGAASGHEEDLREKGKGALIRSDGGW